MPNSAYNKFILLGALFAPLFPSSALPNERWTVNGMELALDTNVPYADIPNSTELVPRDVTEFKLYVMENPQIDTVVLTSTGGYGPASWEIIDTILEFGLNTRVVGECLSACAHIFLAGTTRSLEPEASLGFHRPYIIGSEERAYYMANREARGWQDEFDYVEFIYDVGLSDMLQMVNFMNERGVSLSFIQEAYSYDSYSMWEPDPTVLFKSGVLTELPMEND